MNLGTAFRKLKPTATERTVFPGRYPAYLLTNAKSRKPSSLHSFNPLWSKRERINRPGSAEGSAKKRSVLADSKLAGRIRVDCAALSRTRFKDRLDEAWKEERAGKENSPSLAPERGKWT